MFFLLLMFPFGVGFTVLGTVRNKHSENLDIMAGLMFVVPVLIVAALLSGPEVPA